MAVCAGALALAGVAPPAVASARALLRVGVAPRLPASSTVAGSLASNTRVGVTLTLEPRDPAGLAAYATAVATPGSSVYHDYITPAQFAQRFGPTGTQIAAVESSLRAHGLNPGAVSPNGLAIRVAATAGQLGQAFSTSFERVVAPGGRTAFANTSAPAFDASVAGDVQGVVGLETLSIPQPLALRTRVAGASKLTAPHVATGGPQPCPAATAVAAAPGNKADTADQIASAYDFSGFYGAGDFGAGQTVAIYELEGNFPSDVAAYQSCYKTSASVNYKKVDPGPAAPVAANQDGLESELDIEDLIGLAPKASLIVYQGQNSNSGAYNTYAAIITQDLAKVISTSWGLCESQEGAASTSAENTLFQEAATQGQSILAASGDQGSEDCYDPMKNPGATGLAVDDPASQPFVTGVGGTKLTAPGPPPSETVWSDANGGGGGGISTIWPMPAYQSGAAPWLGVINANSSGTPCRASAGSDCREVPDVSADASDQSSYLIYWNGHWTGVYGTSGAAPTWASLITLANASSACTGSPIGFANPVIYQVAGSTAYANVFNDIISGNNDFLGVHGGVFPAGAGYDMASGLGTPIAFKLAGVRCDNVAMANPGLQISVVGSSVNLQMAGTSSSGSSLRYTATGLPAGLSINSATGMVSGVPTTVGTQSVTVFVSSADGLGSSTSLTWNVVSALVTITDPGNRTGTVGKSVAIQISASDNNGRALTYGARGLPRGLSINAASGLVSGRPAAAGRSTVTLTAATSGAAPATTTFKWTINPAASTSHYSLSGVGKGRPRLSFTVAAASGSPLIETIVIGLPKGLSFSTKAKSLVKGIGCKESGRTRLKFAAKVVHGSLTITLKRSASKVQITISSVVLAVTKRLARKIEHKDVRALSVVVRAINSSHVTTRLGLKLGV